MLYLWTLSGAFWNWNSIRDLRPAHRSTLMFEHGIHQPNYPIHGDDHSSTNARQHIRPTRVSRIDHTFVHHRDEHRNIIVPPWRSYTHYFHVDKRPCPCPDHTCAPQLTSPSFGRQIIGIMFYGLTAFVGSVISYIPETHL
jgi:hypothetical protein